MYVCECGGSWGVRERERQGERHKIWVYLPIYCLSLGVFWKSIPPSLSLLLCFVFATSKYSNWQLLLFSIIIMSPLCLAFPAPVLTSFISFSVCITPLSFVLSFFVVSICEPLPSIKFPPIPFFSLENQFISSLCPSHPNPWPVFPPSQFVSPLLWYSFHLPTPQGWGVSLSPDLPSSP